MPEELRCSSRGRGGMYRALMLSRCRKYGLWRVRVFSRIQGVYVPLAQAGVDLEGGVGLASAEGAVSGFGGGVGVDYLGELPKQGAVLLTGNNLRQLMCGEIRLPLVPWSARDDRGDGRGHDQVVLYNGLCREGRQFGRASVSQLCLKMRSPLGAETHPLKPAQGIGIDRHQEVRALAQLCELTNQFPARVRA